jgi:hypothetical protein
MLDVAGLRQYRPGCVAQVIFVADHSPQLWNFNLDILEICRLSKIFVHAAE